VAVGCALSMRSLLHEAVQQVLMEEVPFIFNPIHAIFNQYARNTFMFPDFLPVDSMALDLGIDPESADQPLKVMLMKAISDTDKKLWEYLPVMYAASFSTSSLWRDAQFRPQVEGHLNNVHTLAQTINGLIIAFTAISSATADVSNITTNLLRFLEVSSVILLRVARSRDKHGPVDFPSVVIFMDKFVSASPLLTHDALERCLPYALMRNMYKQIYEEKTGPGKQQETGQDGGF